MYASCLTVWFISNNHMYSTIHFFRNATPKSKDCKTSYKVKIQSPTLHTKKNNCKQTNVAENPKGNNFIWTCYILWHKTVYDTCRYCMNHWFTSFSKVTCNSKVTKIFFSRTIKPISIHWQKHSWMNGIDISL